jgi:dTDP-4-dehydrorhamnose 3,5-epimerase
MLITRQRIPEVLVVEPDVFSDTRGCFFESFNQRRFEAACGRLVAFVQSNHSRSGRNVLRGLNYQNPHPQAMLVLVISGEVYDVAVDLRRNSSTFGQWLGEVLTAENRKHLWIPEGFAHGFLVLSDFAELFYQATDYWYPEHEHRIKWNDSSLAIAWPMQGEPLLSTKDQAAEDLGTSKVFE